MVFKKFIIYKRNIYFFQMVEFDDSSDISKRVICNANKNVAWDYSKEGFIYPDAAI